MKQIRMAILQKGAGPILAFLRDKFQAGRDDVVEQWAIDLDKQLPEYFAQPA